MKEINKHIEAIEKLCAQHHVKSLYAFGSALQDTLKQSSDIDMIVEFKPLDLKFYADNYYHLKFSLQEVFNRPVDLLENQAIRNPYFRNEVEKKKQPVYVA
jgi:predicted nucleotidyltransferase